MPQPTNSHVFMSYSRKDEDVMRRIVTHLRKSGIKVWVDNEKLIPGTPIWEEEIERAISNASAVVIVLSPDSKKSVWVRREISFAEQYHKQIFPIMVAGDEDSSITLRLITNQYVDLRKDEPVGLKSLSTAISFYLEKLTRIKDELKAATEKAERLTMEKQAAEREATRLMAKRETAERAEREVIELTTRRKAEREAAEKAEREAMDLMTRKRAESATADHELEILLRDGNLSLPSEYQGLRPATLPESIRPSRPTSLPEEIKLRGKPTDLPK